MTATLDVPFAADFVAWRAALGFTQEQAADRLGLPVSTVRNYEQGRTQPQHPVLLRLAMETVSRQARRAP